MIGIIVTAVIAGTAGYIAGKTRKNSIGSARGTGLGTGGTPRRGVPKSEAERLATHETRFGSSKLPPRGTGLTKQGF